jgi:hypothetical protein
VGPFIVTGKETSLGDAGYRLMPFLRIAQRAGGDSAAFIREALQRSGYAAVRPSFAAQDVRELLALHPPLLEAWLRYSDAKETPDGWYVLRDGEIGQVSNPAAQRQFGSIEEAVAEFILRELDHHAGAAAAPARVRT